MEWIKVSDRLPDRKMRVLITIHHPDDPTRRCVDECTYDAMDGGFIWWDDYYQETLNYENVIAWMPLPEPYKGD